LIYDLRLQIYDLRRKDTKNLRDTQIKERFFALLCLLANAVYRFAANASLCIGSLRRCEVYRYASSKAAIHD